MPYALKFATTAFEDIQALTATIAPGQQERAVDAIETICRDFADRQRLSSGRWAVPSFPIHFKIDETWYYWAATYRITEDETTVVLTHVFRVPL